MMATRILILDDDTTISELLSEVLQTLGHQTFCCNSAGAALEQIRAEPFDLILSDFRMPGMDGQEFYWAVERCDRDLADRIVFLTGDTLNDRFQGFLTSIGNLHIAKPFQFDEIEGTLAEALNRAKRRDHWPSYEPSMLAPAGRFA